MKNVLIAAVFVTIYSVGYVVGQEKTPSLRLEDKVEILQAQLTVCRTQMSNNSVSRTVQELVQKIEAKYPGFTINLDNGSLSPRKPEERK